MKTNVRSEVRAWTLAVGLFLVILMMCPAKAERVGGFNDPAADGSVPLFIFDPAGNSLTGGWGDYRPSLNLEVVIAGRVFTDAYFSMTEVAYTGGESGGVTGGGMIEFYADGGGVPLMQITFERALVSINGFGAMDPYHGHGVAISGSEISESLVNESFAFAFDNQVDLPGGGFSATASFVASGTVLPEPISALLLGAGTVLLMMWRRVATAGMSGRGHG